MGLLNSFLIVLLAMIFLGSIDQTLSSAMPAYDTMQCLFHSSSDDPNTCLLGGKQTACQTYKCYRTIGHSCSTGHVAKLTGDECGGSLTCGCDKKCNGCITVNGERKCYWGECMPFRPNGKRDQMKLIPSSLDLHDRSIEYPIEDSRVI
ncbi:CLUMA_CG016427, isoform A [Clunio marinus]|uniref:CLUMA_CG016427, isoform A n=1 Tax=Clunio marinus TaxID=568069 RepID=A0A1J1IYN4_9DIPT|nr:CLUMA_CG016427, isoform A [Clunio marinus]